MNMRRLVSVFLLIAFVCSLIVTTGCSKKDEGELDSPELPSEIPDKEEEQEEKEEQEEDKEQEEEKDMLTEEQKKKVIRLEIQSRIKKARDSTWEIITEGATADKDVYRYFKNSGVSADWGCLYVSTNAALGMSFDIFVNSATDGEFQLQLDGGASFASVVDSEGTAIDVQGDPAMPYVVLKQGKQYSLKLDFSKCSGYTALKVWHAKSVDLNYSNISFEHEDGVANSFFRQVVFKSHETLGNFAWPSVERLDGDRIIAVSSGYRQGHIDPYGKVVGWISEDNGMTWGEPFVIADTVLDDRDSGVIYWKGKIFVTWFTAPNRNYSSQPQWADWCSQITPEMEAKHLGANMVVSEDGEKTWSEPELINAFSPHGLIESPDGDLVYVGYTDYDQSRGAFTRIGVITSSDGVNWSEVKVVANEAQKDMYGFHEPHGVYTEDGTLIVQLRTSEGIYQCELAPDSDEFTEFRFIANAPETPPNLLKTSSGALLLTYGYRAPNSGIRVRVSYDNGVNWSQEIIITAEAYDWDMGYADTVELDDGRFLTIFYQKEKYPEHCCIMEVIWELPEKPSGVQTITFDSMGGSAVDSVSGEFGTVVSAPADPTREGFVFMGWYRDDDCTEKYTINLFTETLTVYAKWISEKPIPQANSEDYLRPATESEITTSGYSGNGDVYLYTKALGLGGGHSGPAEMWIDVSQYRNKTLTFSFYLKEWESTNEKILEIDGFCAGEYVFDELSLVRVSDGTPMSFTTALRGYQFTVEQGVWYTATIDVNNSDIVNIFCFYNCGMDLLIADVGIVE